MSFMGAQVASAQQLETESLGAGPFAEMNADIEKTFLGIEVVTVRVRFDQSKAAEFRSILQAPAPDEIYEAQMMRAARRADNVLFAVRFSRDVPLGQFLKQSREDLAEALRSELIIPDTYRRAVSEMQKTFAPLSERGFEKGDTLYYRVRHDSVRRVLTSDENRTLMDRTTPGVDIRQAILAGYFTPASKLARDLVESLIELSPSV